VRLRAPNGVNKAYEPLHQPTTYHRSKNIGFGNSTKVGTQDLKAALRFGPHTIHDLHADVLPFAITIQPQDQSCNAATLLMQVPHHVALVLFLNDSPGTHVVHAVRMQTTRQTQAEPFQLRTRRTRSGDPQRPNSSTPVGSQC